MKLQPQLAEIRKEFEEATEQARVFVKDVAAAQWAKRPARGGWSIAECFIHLNLTSRAFLPLLREAIRSGRAQKLESEGPFRLDLTGRLLCWVIEPPYRMRVKTSEPFEPRAVEPAEKVMAEFDALQRELTHCVWEANGLALNQLKVQSPFAKKVKYSLYSTFCIIPAHERRHLWQAEQIFHVLK